MDKTQNDAGLAAQTLSSSGATAIDFLWREANLPQFEGSEATTNFIRKVDMAFDVLNSRNSFAKGFKAAVSLENLSMWM